MPIDPEVARLQTLPPEMLAEIELSPYTTLDRRLGISTEDAIAWLEGKPHHIRPTTVSPLIRKIVIAMADTLDQDDRDSIVRPLLPTIMGNNDGRELARLHRAVNWLTHERLPEWLELAGSPQHAQRLRELPELQHGDGTNELQRTAQAISEIAAAFDDPTRDLDDHTDNAVAASGFHSVCTSTSQLRIPRRPQVALAAAHSGQPLTPTVLSLQRSWTDLIGKLATGHA